MKIRSLLIPLAVLAFFLGALNRLEDGRRAEGKAQLERAIHRTAISCYAAEGFYPPDVGYMQDHYGLQYDENSYVVHYELTASNWMPEITVLERLP